MSFRSSTHHNSAICASTDSVLSVAVAKNWRRSFDPLLSALIASAMNDSNVIFQFNSIDLYVYGSTSWAEHSITVKFLVNKFLTVIVPINQE